MKRHIAVLLILLPLQIMAQGDDMSIFNRKGAELVTLQGTRLDDSTMLTLMGDDLFDSYYGARQQYKAGLTLLPISILAGSLAGGGWLLLNYWEQNGNSPIRNPWAGGLFIIGNFVMSFGAAAVFITGSTLTFVGNGRLNRVMRRYNSRNGIGMDIELSPLLIPANEGIAAGAGLTISF